MKKMVKKGSLIDFRYPPSKKLFAWYCENHYTITYAAKRDCAVKFETRGIWKNTAIKAYTK